MRIGLSYAEAGKLGFIKSREKADLLYKERIEKYTANPNKCKFCGKIFEYEKRRNEFCNHSCAASLNNKDVNRRLKEQMVKQNLDIDKAEDVKYYFDNKKEYVCENCGIVRNSRNIKYCSMKCQKEHDWKETKKEIENRNSVDLNPIFNSRIAKKYLKEINGIKCSICNTKEWMGKEIPLVLDHISGNSDDWNLNNIRLICGNCDMQTSTYKGKNKGKGRYFRRLRFKNGQSY